MKKLTNKELQTIRKSAAQKTICVLFEISEEKYFEIQYQTGLQFLEYLYTDELIKELEVSKYFWNWWKMEYVQIDEKYLYALKEEGVYATIENYAYYHAKAELMVDSIVFKNLIKEGQINELYSNPA